MAEAKRRSDVKVFVHKTDYARSPGPLQRRLLDAALGGTDYDWTCTLKGSDKPPDKTPVLVRVGQDAALEVLWGNQPVASVTDVLGDELTAVLGTPDQTGVLVAMTVCGEVDDRQLAIRFVEDFC